MGGGAVKQLWGRLKFINWPLYLSQIFPYNNKKYIWLLLPIYTPFRHSFLWHRVQTHSPPYTESRHSALPIYTEFRHTALPTQSPNIQPSLHRVQTHSPPYTESKHTALPTQSPNIQPSLYSESRQHGWPLSTWVMLN